MFGFAELERKFQQRKVTATLQCTGNRLDELSDAGTTQFAGKAGSKGFVSNAEWEGPLLVDVMAAAGVGGLEEDDEDRQIRRQGEKKQLERKIARVLEQCCTSFLHLGRVKRGVAVLPPNVSAHVPSLAPSLKM